MVLAGGWPGGPGFITVMKYGLKVKESLAIRSATPSGVWCIKKRTQDRFHSFIVITFPSRKTNSLVFEGQKFVSTFDLRLDENESSLHVTRLWDNSVVQVMASRVRHVTSNNLVRDIPIRGRIMRGASLPGGVQLVLLLVGGYVEYYELTADGELKISKVFELESDAVQIDFAPPDPRSERPFSEMIAIGKTNYFVALYCNTPSGFQLSGQVNVKHLIETVTFMKHRNGYEVVVGTTAGRMSKLAVNNGQLEIKSEEEVSKQPVRFTKIKVGDRVSLLQTYPSPTLFYQSHEREREWKLPLPPIEFFN